MTTKAFSMLLEAGAGKGWRGFGSSKRVKVTLNSLGRGGPAGPYLREKQRESQAAGRKVEKPHYPWPLPGSPVIISTSCLLKVTPGLILRKRHSGCIEAQQKPDKLGRSMNHLKLQNQPAKGKSKGRPTNQSMIHAVGF